MKCPNCESEDIKRLEVIYEQETYETNAISKTEKKFFLLNSTSQTQTSATTMSIAAKRSIPPKKKSYDIPIMFIIFGFILLFFKKIFLIGILLITVFTFNLIERIGYNKNDWPKEYDEWKKSWMCTRCGNIFKVEEVELEKIN